MIMRFLPLSFLSVLLVAAPLTSAQAQNSIGPLPASPPATAVRAPIAVPPTPDLTLPPTPAIPDQGDIPAGPVTELPPSRFPGPVTGPVPDRLPEDRSTLLYPAGAELLPAGTDAVLSDIVARLKARPAERLELRAYASTQRNRPTDSRRMALLRARALRDRLVQLGLDPLRLLVFAEGIPPSVEGIAAPAGASDRVDMVIRP
jgi:hypothetical protein